MRERKVWNIWLYFITVINMGLIFFVFIGGVAFYNDPKIESKEKIIFRSVPIPDSLLFADECVPLNRFDIKESLDRELLVNSYFHSQTIRLLKLAPRYFSIIEPILKEKGVPDDFKYLAVAESGLKERAVSPAGAVGLWQMLRGTAREYGLEVNSEIDERYHIEKSTYAACDYLLKAYEKFNSWTMVAAAYNRGMNGVMRQVNRQKCSSYYDLLFGEETARYVFRIIALKLIMQEPNKYNFVIKNDEKYPIVKTREVEILGGVRNFADFAKKNGVSYKVLKDFNPWIRKNSLVNYSKRKYSVKIPVFD